MSLVASRSRDRSRSKERSGQDELRQADGHESERRIHYSSRMRCDEFEELSVKGQDSKPLRNDDGDHEDSSSKKDRKKKRKSERNGDFKEHKKKRRRDKDRDQCVDSGDFTSADADAERSSNRRRRGKGDEELVSIDDDLSPGPPPPPRRSEKVSAIDVGTDTMERPDVAKPLSPREARSEKRAALKGESGAEVQGKSSRVAAAQHEDRTSVATVPRAADRWDNDGFFQQEAVARAARAAAEERRRARLAQERESRYATDAALFQFHLPLMPPIMKGCCD